MTDPSGATNQAHDDLERPVIAALDEADGFPEWDELSAAVGSVSDDELDGAVKALQSEGVLQYSGRHGGYTLVDDGEQHLEQHGDSQ